MHGSVFSAWECVYCMGVCLVHGSVFSAWECV